MTISLAFLAPDLVSKAVSCGTSCRSVSASVAAWLILSQFGRMRLVAFGRRLMMIQPAAFSAFVAVVMVVDESRPMLSAIFSRPAQE